MKLMNYRQIDTIMKTNWHGGIEELKFVLMRGVGKATATKPLL